MELRRPGGPILLAVPLALAAALPSAGAAGFSLTQPLMLIFGPNGIIGLIRNNTNIAYGAALILVYLFLYHVQKIGARRVPFLEGEGGTGLSKSGATIVTAVTLMEILGLILIVPPNSKFTQLMQNIGTNVILAIMVFGAYFLYKLLRGWMPSHKGKYISLGLALTIAGLIGMSFLSNIQQPGTTTSSAATIAFIGGIIITIFGIAKGNPSERTVESEEHAIGHDLERLRRDEHQDIRQEQALVQEENATTQTLSQERSTEIAEEKDEVGIWNLLSRWQSNLHSYQQHPTQQGFAALEQERQVINNLVHDSESQIDTQDREEQSLLGEESTEGSQEMKELKRYLADTRRLLAHYHDIKDQIRDPQLVTEIAQEESYGKRFKDAEDKMISFEDEIKKMEKEITNINRNIRRLKNKQIPSLISVQALASNFSEVYDSQHQILLDDQRKRGLLDKINMRNDEVRHLLLSLRAILVHMQGATKGAEQEDQNMEQVPVLNG